MKLQVKVFRTTMRDIAKMTMNVTDANLFKACKHEKPRLKGLGIATRMSMANFRAIVNETTQKEIARNILRSQNPEKGSVS
jgi:hypothetical protein